MSGRFSDIQDSVSKVNTVLPGKDIGLEKGDFKALMAAAWSTLGKTALLTMAFFAAVILILSLLWSM